MLGDRKPRLNAWQRLSDVVIHDGVNTAIKNAKRRMANFDLKKYKPSEYNPGTMVYKLVEDLKKFID